jgi:membrane-associated phospholipid phosphatase
MRSLEMTIIVGATVALVGVSRVILKRHHVSDVLAGAVLGALLGWLVFHLLPFS